MVVDHADSLHKSVTDGRTDEFKPAPFQILAHGVGFLRPRRDLLHAPAPVADGLAAGELPDVPVKTAELLPDLEERPGVQDGGADFQAVADYPRVPQQALDLGGAVARDPARIETVISLAVIFPLVEYRRPAQARLRALQDQQLE
jgi:hypothetical protein